MKRMCLVAAGFSFALLATSALADPPLRVGRISYTEGDVSMHDTDPQTQWAQAQMNYPVVAGDAFWTQPDGRAEIQIGSVELRMDHGTEVDMTQLDENGTQIQVDQGVVNVHIRADHTAQPIHIVLPSGEVELAHVGSYRIDAGAPDANNIPAPQVTATALEGDAQFIGPNATVNINPGETATLTTNPVSFNISEAVPTDFDNWALARERRELAAQSDRYVSPHMTGYSDLDAYGQWSTQPQYGAVWYPSNISSGWAPYREGHWAYVNPWGWTWIDSDPWGFAPFHYGRWAQIDGRWGWCPGQMVERPVYAPALVAFIGGTGWGISISAGSPAIGWVPLGPSEPFYPYYHTSPGYLQQVNNGYAHNRGFGHGYGNNMHFANYHAATVVPGAAFASGARVGKAMFHVAPAQLQHAHPVMAMNQFAPKPGAILGHGSIAASGRQAAQPPHRTYNATPRAAGMQEHPPAMQMHTPPMQRASEPMHHPVENPSAMHATPAMQHPEAAHGAVPMQQHPAHAMPPVKEITHPVQKTRVMPTAQGWKRVPAPQAKPAPHPQEHTPTGKPGTEERGHDHQ
jgi:hypothetical protein